MSVAIISMKQMADLAYTLRRSVNNTKSKCKDRFEADFTTCMCKNRHRLDIGTLESRDKDVEQFFRDCVMWNWRTYRERYIRHEGTKCMTEEYIAERVEEYANAEGEPISREQAIMTLRSLIYNCDYDCQVDDDEEHKELLAAYKVWFDRAIELKNAWCANIAYDSIERKKCQWWY